ncbi:DUF3794 domain-containing protein [Lutibacter sp. B2]|nr:DUF3794 domain-containing protein [Lutibacter sp. B2]
MAVELITDLLKIDQIVGENDNQALVEGEILVPDVKPDISRILSADATVTITKKEAVQDKIIVDGVVSFKILYASENGEYPVYSVNASAGFSQNVDVENTVMGMQCNILSKIEHVDVDIINERKLSIKAVVNLEGKSIETSKMEVLSDMTGLEDVQMLREKITYNDQVGQNTSDLMVREKFEIEEEFLEIAEVIKCNAYALEKEKQVTDGKVIISGILKVNTLYVGYDDNNSLHLLKHEIPFTHFVEVSGAQKGMKSKLSLNVDEVYTDIGENIEGARKVLEIEANVKANVVVNEQEEKEVIIDAYSTSKNLNLEKEKVNLKQMIGENTANMIVKEGINVPSNQPDIFKVCDANATPIITDVSVVEDKVIIEGIIDANVLYLSKDAEQPAHGFRQEIPFRHFVEVEGAKEDMQAEVDMKISDVGYTLVSPEQVEMKINLGAECVVSKSYSISVLKNVEELEEKLDVKSRPSIVIYYAQPGDSLWKIAKRYHTTVEELVKTNDIENPEAIMPGEQIFIQKTYEYKY